MAESVRSCASCVLHTISAERRLTSRVASKERDAPCAARSNATVGMDSRKSGGSDARRRLAPARSRGARPMAVPSDASSRFAPSSRAPDRQQSSRFARTRHASRKSASSRSAAANFASCRSANRRFAPISSVPSSSAPEKSPRVPVWPCDLTHSSCPASFSSNAQSLAALGALLAAFVSRAICDSSAPEFVPREFKRASASMATCPALSGSLPGIVWPWEFGAEAVGGELRFTSSRSRVAGWAATSSAGWSAAPPSASPAGKSATEKSAAKVSLAERNSLAGTSGIFAGRSGVAPSPAACGVFPDSAGNTLRPSVSCSRSKGPKIRPNERPPCPAKNPGGKQRQHCPGPVHVPPGSVWRRVCLAAVC